MAQDIRSRELQMVAELERQRETVDAALEHAVADAHRSGASWSEISDALGTSKQSAWSTYRGRVQRLMDIAAAEVDQDEETLLESAATSLGRTRMRRSAAR